MMTQGHNNTDTQEGLTDSERNRNRRQEQQRRREAELAAAPFVALTVRGTGIHPASGRVVSLDAVTFNADFEVVSEFRTVINPGGGVDPGPEHYHGLSHEDIAAGKRFSQVLKALDRFLDGRTLLLHDAPRAWGFIVSESRRAMNAAARSNRSRGRAAAANRGRRRHRVGHVPQPVAIIDTLESARRAGIFLTDARQRSVARALGIDTTPARASVARAQELAADSDRADTLLLVEMYQQLRARHSLSSRTPAELRSDKFGLQRSSVRVDAVEAPRVLSNPGKYTPGGGLLAGMEVVIAPEITMDPNRIIDALMRAGLAYSEKLTRETSVVVCNRPAELVGKAMHAERKEIPLLSDEEFLVAVARMHTARR